MGGASIIRSRNVTGKWKPILIYSQGNWQERGQWPDVLMVNSKEKDWHDWQEPLEEVEKLVRYFSKPGDLVVDTCGGGFTTAVACRNLGRRCIACDIDQACGDPGTGSARWEGAGIRPRSMTYTSGDSEIKIVTPSKELGDPATRRQH